MISAAFDGNKRGDCKPLEGAEVRSSDRFDAVAEAVGKFCPDVSKPLNLGKRLIGWTIAECARWKVVILTGIVWYLKKELDIRGVICYCCRILNHNRLF